MAFAKYGERLFGGGRTGSHPQIAYCTVLDFQEGCAASLFNLGASSDLCSVRVI
jgi:hypothetical protein